MVCVLTDKHYYISQVILLWNSFYTQIYIIFIWNSSRLLGFLFNIADGGQKYSLWNRDLHAKLGFQAMKHECQPAFMKGIWVEMELE